MIRKAAMVEQGLGHLLGGGTDVDEQGGVVGNVGRDQPCDALLLGLAQNLARRVGDVLDESMPGRHRHDAAAERPPGRAH